MAHPPLLIQRFDDGSQSTETRRVRHVATMRDYPYRNARLQDLALLDVPNPGSWVPVGNVPFVQAWAARCGKTLPNPDTYPEALRPFLGRRIQATSVGQLLSEHPQGLSKTPWFIKPVQVKAFDGFVANANSAHSHEQLAILATLAKTTPVFVSEVVRFVAEWRCYFGSSDVLAGVARYDEDGEYESEDLSPEQQTEVLAMGHAMGLRYPFALDVGLVGDRLLLVEHNDAWALGLYQGMDAQAYLAMLVQRWDSLLELHPRNDANLGMDM